MLHPNDRLGILLLLSLVLHLAIIFGVHFSHPERKKDDLAPQLEIVLVSAKTAASPAQPKALAQANLDGGGNTEEKLRARNPLPPSRNEAGEDLLKEKHRKLASLEEEAAKLITSVRESEPSTVPVPPPNPKPAPQPRQENLDAEDLYARSLDAARLQAQIEKDYQAYQERPRRKFIGASTREYIFARYLEDWRAKVERVGNLNYPEEARRRKIYGSLRLTVSIRADGSVDKIEIDRSSGEPVLDEAARRIVSLASPFGAFSKEMKAQVDILSITRTWTFTRYDQLSDSN